MRSRVWVNGRYEWTVNVPSEAWSHDLGGGQIITKSAAHSKEPPKPEPKKKSAS